MKILALITEYNPFHNGHIYHIKKAQEKIEPDLTVVIMSGNFTQRGEIAITDKFTRTREVLKHVDLVIELPFLNAVSYADDFALGAVHTAHLVGASHLVFGSEDGQIDNLKQAAKEAQELNVNDDFKTLLKEGMSYPRALAHLADSNLLGSPNNTLGIAYINAVEKLGANISVDTIQRIGNNYNDKTLSSLNFSSATSLRNSLLNGNYEEAKAFMPASLIEEMVSKHLASNEDLFISLKIKILTMSISELRSIYMMTEGLEYRLKEKIKEATSFDEFLSKVKTKRYTWTRLSRLMISILMNVKKSDMTDLTDHNSLRILGMNKIGQAHLKTLNDVHIITNVNKKNRHLVSREVTSTAVYNTVTHGQLNDFNTPVIIVP